MCEKDWGVYGGVKERFPAESRVLNNLCQLKGSATLNCERSGGGSRGWGGTKPKKKTTGGGRGGKTPTPEPEERLRREAKRVVTLTVTHPARKRKTRGKKGRGLKEKETPKSCSFNFSKKGRTGQSLLLLTRGTPGGRTR